MSQIFQLGKKLLIKIADLQKKRVIENKNNK